jgi:hypothetical protein
VASGSLKSPEGALRWANSLTRLRGYGRDPSECVPAVGVQPVKARTTTEESTRQAAFRTCLVLIWPAPLGSQGAVFLIKAMQLPYARCRSKTHCRSHSWRGTT